LNAVAYSKKTQKITASHLADEAITSRNAKATPAPYPKAVEILLDLLLKIINSKTIVSIQAVKLPVLVAPYQF
jgi:hypothetical protein